MKKILKLKIKKLDRGATLPDYAYLGDAGLDLYSNVDVSLQPSERKIISTGIALEIPTGYVGLIWDKSSLGIKNILKTLGGVVDSGYRGEVKVGLINLSKKDFQISQGQKIAQMIIQKKETVVVEEVKELSETERSEKGFGSSEPKDR
jgi:dUTP pyrophosphatase